MSTIQELGAQLVELSTLNVGLKGQLTQLREEITERDTQINELRDIIKKVRERTPGALPQDVIDAMDREIDKGRGRP